MTNVWFKRKKYGYGWYPANLKGWLVILEYILFVGLNFVWIDLNSHSASDTLSNFIPQTIIATLGLITVCFLKGETPRWQWGEKQPKIKSRRKKK